MTAHFFKRVYLRLNTFSNWGLLMSEHFSKRVYLRVNTFLDESTSKIAPRDLCPPSNPVNIKKEGPLDNEYTELKHLGRRWAQIGRSGV